MSSTFRCLLFQAGRLVKVEAPPTTFMAMQFKSAVLHSCFICVGRLPSQAFSKCRTPILLHRSRYDGQLVPYSLHRHSVWALRVASTRAAGNRYRPQDESLHLLQSPTSLLTEKSDYLGLRDLLRKCTKVGKGFRACVVELLDAYHKLIILVQVVVNNAPYFLSITRLPCPCFGRKRQESPHSPVCLTNSEALNCQWRIRSKP